MASSNPSKSRVSKKKASGSSSDRVILSGGFLQIFGLGVIIVGDSGIGKSESALELVSRGHRFISDDVVDVCRFSDGRLVGRAPSLSRYFMEIRGLGIINIKEIFGARAICRQSDVNLVVRLKKWERGDEYDRLGLEFPEDYEILGVKTPQLILPVAPGRTIALLIEVACKVHLLRKRGYHASQEIVKKLDRALS
jgi:HPr kinase/phosphorylase